MLWHECFVKDIERTKDSSSSHSRLAENTRELSHASDGFTLFLFLLSLGVLFSLPPTSVIFWEQFIWWILRRMQVPHKPLDGWRITETRAQLPSGTCNPTSFFLPVKKCLSTLLFWNSLLLLRQSKIIVISSEMCVCVRLFMVKGSAQWIVTSVWFLPDALPRQTVRLAVAADGVWDWRRPGKVYSPSHSSFPLPTAQSSFSLASHSNYLWLFI